MVPYRTLAIAVSRGITRLGLEISHVTCQAAYELFTPNNSGQRSPPTYYRGCWHVVGRLLLQVPSQSSLLKVVYNPEGLRPTRGVAASGFRPLRKIPHCCLP